MSALPGVGKALAEETPAFLPSQVAGSHWQPDWRDRYLIAPDLILNHNKPSFLGVLDGTEAVADWDPWAGVKGPHPGADQDSSLWGRFAGALRFTPGGDDSTTLQVYAQATPLAIDARDREPAHGQMLPSGTGFASHEIPFIDDDQMKVVPWHYDWGDQIDSGSAIGPRQIFRQPPSYGDQTAAVYAAGF